MSCQKNKILIMKTINLKFALLSRLIILSFLLINCQDKELIPKPIANFSYSPSSNLTAPISVTFTNTSQNANSYEWSINGQIFTTKNLSFQFSQAGTYTIILTATGDGGTDSYSQSITILRPITPTTSPVAGFSFSPNSNITAPAKITFTNTSLNAISYKWDFGDGTTSTVTNPVKDFLQAGDYNVKLTATDAKNQSNQASATISVKTAPVVNNDGTYTFFIKSDLKVGNIEVTVNNVLRGTITQYHSSGVTCGQGNVNVTLPAGTYAFSAKATDGTTWKDNVTFEKGTCKTQELTKSANSGGGAGTNCDWTSAIQCVQVNYARVGTRCGTKNSVEIEYQNICNSNIKVVHCIQKADGTWSCWPDGTFDTGLKPNQKVQDFVCAGTGKYKIYAMPITDYIKNKCPYPKE
jgi:PKD repeat protein